MMYSAVKKPFCLARKILALPRFAIGLLVVALCMRVTHGQPPSTPTVKPVALEADLPPLSRNGKWFAAVGGTHANLIRIWDTQIERVVRRIQIPRDSSITQLAFSPDSRSLATSGLHGLSLFEVETGRLLRQLLPPGSSCGELLFAPNGKSLLVNTIDSVREIDIESGQLRSSIPYPLGPDGLQNVSMLTLNLWGDLVSGITESGIHVWRIADGKQIRHIPFSEQTNGCHSLALSPSGLLLAAAMGQGGITIWEVQSGSEIAQVRQEFQIPSGIQFSPDSRLIAGVNANSVSVLDVISGEPKVEFSLATDHGDDFIAMRAAFSADGTTLIALLADPERVVPQRKSWNLSAHIKTVGSDPQSADERRLNENEIQQYWEKLGSTDARQAQQSVRQLTEHPREAVEMLDRELRGSDMHAASADERELETTLRRLDHESFVVREKAAQFLRSAGRLAEPLLNRALQNRPTFEAKQRIHRLLEELSDARLGKSLQRIRAVQTLELIGSPTAHATIEWLAKSSEQPAVRDEATAAMTRFAMQRSLGP